MRAVPRDQWSIFAQRLIWHGRRVCFAKKPDCEHCPLAPVCPSAGLGLPALARGSGARIAQRPAGRGSARTQPAGAKGKPNARRKSAAPSSTVAKRAKRGAKPAPVRKEQRI
jgi:adenine-specific DNA glycosylase